MSNSIFILVFITIFLIFSSSLAQTTAPQDCPLCIKTTNPPPCSTCIKTTLPCPQCTTTIPPPKRTPGGRREDKLVLLPAPVGRSGETSYTNVKLFSGPPVDDVCLGVKSPPVLGNRVEVVSCEIEGYSVVWNVGEGITMDFQGQSWGLQAGGILDGDYVHIYPQESTSLQNWGFISEGRISLQGTNLCLFRDNYPVLGDCDSSDGIETWIPTAV
ncbi:hypothetical protein TREMEDRAFT_61447 [Tremella mesenterica DSM 1558]|uniref:uncharacterized protein n=1 Tax=Tremella mesenterica (strain ATCC 24925 / CBS 8224 / DSM 1558 / NBRC 9311 / NRRL Y-6157 / RJB 2259-6 / UBC 559-6) TaxID=578456 RepID=UPI0003F48D83|nr:uncharacterized protein TREMEDRAFT_61447 [Tremella mesenterica DSM 1558]EIW70934.1 hypothetical protein TREMEDRAFT_61447 [Tremella mesenterica DSM 1558]